MARRRTQVGSLASARGEAERKRELRRERWAALREAGAARFPGAVGRIPNFTGAEAAAERLAGDRRWRRARVLECNPDLAQRPVRYRALRDGKRIYLAVPRLAEAKPFVLLDPAKLGEKALWVASSIRGAFELGRPVALARLEPIDLIVSGCVAAARDGARLGKGGGYSDLEYALLREEKKVGPRTPVVTTLHPTQVLPRGRIPMRAHDVPVDLFVTPHEAVTCPRTFRRPGGIAWDELEAEKRASIPVLARRRKR